MYAAGHDGVFAELSENGLKLDLERAYAYYY
jgi:hypothetical protein